VKSHILVAGCIFSRPALSPNSGPSRFVPTAEAVPKLDNVNIRFSLSNDAAPALQYGQHPETTSEVGTSFIVYLNN